MLRRGDSGPLVSVIIPTFNRAALIERAIASVLAQVGAPPLEIIVVDDCSTDHTPAVVAAFNDARVRHLRLTKNLGGAAARNAGIHAARGQYIAFLDSDDAWRSEKLRRQLLAIHRSETPDSTVCHTQIRVCRPRPAEIVPATPKDRAKPIAHYLFLDRGHMQTSSLMLPTALARRTLFDPALRKHQDYDFCLRLERNGADFLLVPLPLVLWNHDARGDRITRRNGVVASLHFLETRGKYMGNAASAAFWIKHIFPTELKRSPFPSMRRILALFFKGTLPLSWYALWIKDAVEKRIRCLSKNCFGPRPPICDVPGPRQTSTPPQSSNLPPSDHQRGTSA